MDYLISQEGLNDLAALVQEMPTKYGIPITNIIQKSVRQMPDSEPETTKTGWVENAKVGIFKGTRKAAQAVVVSVNSKGAKSKVTLDNGTDLITTISAVDAGDVIEQDGLTYKLI